MPKRRKASRVSALKQNTQTHVYPTLPVLKKLRRTLKPFKPFDLRSIVGQAAAKGIAPIDLWDDECNAQCQKLLKRMNLHSDTNWKNAFALLGMALLDVGRVDFKRRRRSSHARRWDWKQDARFALAVEAQIDQGLSERQAVEAVAADPTIHPRYKAARRNDRRSDEINRVDTLWSRWGYLKKVRISQGEWPASVVPLQPQTSDPLAQLLEHLDSQPLMQSRRMAKRKKKLK